MFALALDGRGGKNRIFAAASSMHWGSVIRRSDDFGKTWDEPTEANVKFPEDTKAALKQIWQIRPGREDEPQKLWAGVEPAALFESNDGGGSWSLVRSLWNHPHREKWEPGGGGLCMHTVSPHPTDPNRMLIAISTGGVYRTDDGGKSWSASNKGVRAEFLPDKHPEFGQCVHKIARSPVNPERLFLQNHWGLYRSDDEGRTWTDIANGVPSDFGFPIAVHPTDPDTSWSIPLESDMFRCTPEGKLRVFKTTNAGRTWKGMTKGLPQEGAFETVLRDALATDGMDTAGVVFGTRSGKVFGSPDEGTSWRLIADGLPPVTCVRSMQITRK